MLERTAPMLLAASEVWVYVLPLVGSMLLFYGVFQAITENKSSQNKKMQERLRGDRQKREKATSTIIRRGGVGQSGSFADLVVGKFKFIPKLQTLLDQADVDWSASKMMLNLCGIAVFAALALSAMQIKLVAAIGCGGAVVVLPLAWLSFRRKRRMTKLNAQLPDVFEMMGQALRAGHSLAGAIQLIYEQMPPPIATEFAQVYHEQTWGSRSSKPCSRWPTASTPSTCASSSPRS